MNEPGPADLDMTVKLTLPTIEPYQQAADATTQFAAITAGSPPGVYSSSQQRVPTAVGAGPPPAMPMAGYGMPVSPAVGYGPPMYAYHPAYGPPGPEHAVVPAYHYPQPPPRQQPVQKNVPMSFLLSFAGTLTACLLTVTLVLLLR